MYDLTSSCRGTLVLIVLTSACGSEKKQDKSDEGNAGIQAGIEFVDVSVSQLDSKNPLVDKNGIIFDVDVDGKLLADGSWQYDVNKQESLLIFHLASRLKSDVLEPDVVFYHTTTLSTPSPQQSLYTTFDVGKIARMGYDADEARIYLRNGDQSIEVGRFRKPAASDGEDQRVNIYKSPLLCEGPYAAVCKVQAGVWETKGSGPTVGAQVIVTLLSKPQTRIVFNPDESYR